MATYENCEVTSIVVKLQKILEYPFSPPNHFLFFSTDQKVSEVFGQGRGYSAKVARCLCVTTMQ